MVESVYPTFIVCRDRVSCLKDLVSWLESVGQELIYLVDNNSTYGPLLEYYENTPHHVIRLKRNIGHNVVWDIGLVEKYAKDSFYIVSDPDVIPVEYCPSDAITKFRELLDRYPYKDKCGFGLKIDDLPDHYRLKSEVIKHESQYHSWPSVSDGIFAPIDTTFALYRANCGVEAFSSSIRTKEPYIARHLPWYVDSNNITEEEAYYRRYADQKITNWNKDKI